MSTSAYRPLVYMKEIMKTNKLKKFVSLRHTLEKERIELQARLREVEQALGTGGNTPAAVDPLARSGKSKLKPTKSRRRRRSRASNAKAPVNRAQVAGATSRPGRRRKRRASAETRAKLSAAATERWAKKKAAGKKSL